MKEKNIVRGPSDKYLVLDESSDNLVYFGFLLDVLTGNKTKKEMIDKIRRNILPSGDKDKLKNERLDMAIILHIDSKKYERQDIDNISKIILDTFKKQSEEDKEYLFEDDCQVVRLLIQKVEKRIIEGFNTSQCSVSIRKHDSSKDMKLREIK